MRLFQKQSAEPDGSAEGKSFKLVWGDLNPAILAHSHMAPAWHPSIPSAVQTIDSMPRICVHSFLWFVRQRERKTVGHPQRNREWDKAKLCLRAPSFRFLLFVYLNRREPSSPGGEQKAIHRKLDNQFCDFEISLIFHLALPPRSKKSSWYAYLLRRSVFLPYASPPSVLVLPWQVTLLDRWQALTFWQLTPLDVQRHCV